MWTSLKDCQLGWNTSHSVFYIYIFIFFSHGVYYPFHPGVTNKKMQHFKVWITPYPHWEWTKCNAKNMMKLNTSTCAFMTWSWMYCCSHHYGLGVCGIYVNSSTVEEGAMGKTSPLQSRGLIHFDWSSLLYLWVCDAIFWVTWCLSSCFHIIFTS